MIRLLVGFAACSAIALGAFLLIEGRTPSTHERLLRESESILPPEARVLSREYDDRCYDLFVTENMAAPSCLTVRFVLAGSRDRQILDRSRSRWSVARSRRDDDGWELALFRPGERRATVRLRTPEAAHTCRSAPLVVVSCDDYVRIELGARPVIPKLHIELGADPATDEELLERLRENPPRPLVDPKTKP
jgi:hypothetical protein